MSDGQATPGRKRRWRRHDEIPVAELNRTNPVRFAIIGFIVVAIAVYFGFTKALPFKHGFKLDAVFVSAQNVHSKSPVRIAGVNVGKVTAIRREGSAGVVEMEIRDLVAGSFLEHAPLVPTSVVTGTGLQELRARLSALEDTVRSRARDVDSYVRDNPWQAVAVVGGIALLIGLAMGRR